MLKIRRKERKCRKKKERTREGLEVWMARGSIFIRIKREL
jgi:hypothetical protein